MVLLTFIFNNLLVCVCVGGLREPYVILLWPRVDFAFIYFIYILFIHCAQLLFLALFSKMIPGGG